MTASSEESPGKGKSNPAEERAKFRLGMVVLVAAVGVLLIDSFLIKEHFDGPPVAAPFTRVGGATHVETAVDATRFWLTPPRNVVEVSASADEQTMLDAAQCAMAYDAPLLFAPSHNEIQQKLVMDTLIAWHLDGKVKPPKNKEIITINSSGETAGCSAKAKKAAAKSGNRADTKELWTFSGAPSLVTLPAGFSAQGTLAKTVVFAASWEPNFAPDVAVGMALSAHLVVASGHPVSLVVVPRYLEADPTLESKLESQHEVVAGGVVLGQAITIPDDTRALLRQLLTSRDWQGLLEQIDKSLGDIAPFVEALLAGIALWAALKTGRRVIPELVRRIGQVSKSASARFGKVARAIGRLISQVAVWLPGMLTGVRISIREGKVIMALGWGSNNNKESPRGINWRAILGSEAEVIVWLRSGKRVDGTVEKWYPESTEQNKDQPAADEMLRLKNAYLMDHEDQMEPMKFVLIPVEDIELISQGDPDRPTKSNPARVSISAS